MLLSLTLLLGILSAQETNAPAPDDEPFLAKGTVTYGLMGSVGIAHSIFDGVGNAEILYLGGHAGKVLSDPLGPAFLRGNLAFDVEVLPLALVFQDGTSYAFSTTLLGRHYLKKLSGARPFITFGAGFLWSTSELPPDTSRVNFTPQIGLGVSFTRESRTYSLEYRLHHISNADLVKPNPGINSSLFQFRTTFFRARKPDP